MSVRDGYWEKGFCWLQIVPTLYRLRRLQEACCYGLLVA
jgi:hypothetical protein